MKDVFDASNHKATILAPKPKQLLTATCSKERKESPIKHKLALKCDKTKCMVFTGIWPVFHIQTLCGLKIETIFFE